MVETASKLLGYLRRTLKGAPIRAKLMVYQTLVLPEARIHISQLASVSKLPKYMKAVQSRALRSIYSGYPFHTSITELRAKASDLTSPQHLLISRLHSLMRSVIRTFSL